MLRSIGAVLTGYLVFAVSAVLLFKLAARDPHAAAPLGFIILTTLYGMTFAILAGYVAAWLAGRRPLDHAIALAALIASGGLISMVLSAEGGARWSQVGAVVLMAPAAILGGLIRRRAVG